MTNNTYDKDKAIDKATWVTDVEFKEQARDALNEIIRLLSSDNCQNNYQITLGDDDIKRNSLNYSYYSERDSFEYITAMNTEEILFGEILFQSGGRPYIYLDGYRYAIETYTMCFPINPEILNGTTFILAMSSDNYLELSLLQDGKKPVIFEYDFMLYRADPDLYPENELNYPTYLMKITDENDLDDISFIFEHFINKFAPKVKKAAESDKYPHPLKLAPGSRRVLASKSTKSEDGSEHTLKDNDK